MYIDRYVSMNICKYIHIPMRGVGERLGITFQLSVDPQQGLKFYFLHNQHTSMFKKAGLKTRRNTRLLFLAE